MDTPNSDNLPQDSANPVPQPEAAPLPQWLPPPEILKGDQPAEPVEPEVADAPGDGAVETVESTDTPGGDDAQAGDDSTAAAVDQQGSVEDEEVPSLDELVAPLIAQDLAATEPESDADVDADEAEEAELDADEAEDPADEVLAKTADAETASSDAEEEEESAEADEADAETADVIAEAEETDDEAGEADAEAEDEFEAESIEPLFETTDCEPALEPDPVSPIVAEAAPETDDADADAVVAEADEPADKESAVDAASPTEIIAAESPLPDRDPVTAEAAEEEVHLPWDDAAADAEEVQASMPAEDITAEPPAVAFAPAFLALDEDGQPVPDEVVDHLPEPIPSLPPVPLEPEVVKTPAKVMQSCGGGIWTIPLICFGIAIIACCLLIPQADDNGRLVWEREKLRRDLEQIQKQVDVNEEFLRAMADDQILTERLAQRQMNVVRAGTAVLELEGNGGLNSSPFQLVTVPPPEPLPEYQPPGGRFAELCRNPRTQLYLIGGSLLLIAIGLLLGRDEPSADDSVLPA